MKFIEKVWWTCPHCKNKFNINDPQVEVDLSYYTTAKCPACSKGIMEDEPLDIERYN